MTNRFYHTYSLNLVTLLSVLWESNPAICYVGKLLFTVGYFLVGFLILDCELMLMALRQTFIGYCEDWIN